ncbi:CorA metal ion transporter [Ascosphaera acerosa]|nr:CorA metal ion transporter [Ascosphaera acerosa]
MFAMDGHGRGSATSDSHAVSGLRQNLANAQPSKSSNAESRQHHHERSVSNGAGTTSTPRGRRHGRKRRGHRRPSFAFSPSGSPDVGEGLLEESEPPQEIIDEDKPGFFRVPRRNLSDASLDSQALLDHRDQPSMRFRPRQGSSLSHSLRLDDFHRDSSPEDMRPRHRSNTTLTANKVLSMARSHPQYERDTDDDFAATAHDRTPLLSKSYRAPVEIRRQSYATSSTPTSRWRNTPNGSSYAKPSANGVNNPPSVPGSPPQKAARRSSAHSSRSPPVKRSPFSDIPYEAVIEVDRGADHCLYRPSLSMTARYASAACSSDGWGCDCC